MDGNVKGHRSTAFKAGCKIYVDLSIISKHRMLFQLAFRAGICDSSITAVSCISCLY
jgi:hypothetical protein